MKHWLEICLVLSSSPIHIVARANPLWRRIPLTYDILINMLTYQYIGNIDTKFAPNLFLHIEFCLWQNWKLR